MFEKIAVSITVGFNKEKLSHFPVNYNGEMALSTSLRGNVYKLFSLMFLKDTWLPWSCRHIFPCLYVPKPGHSLNLLPATSFFQLSSQRVVDTTFSPLR